MRTKQLKCDKCNTEVLYIGTTGKNKLYYCENCKRAVSLFSDGICD